MVRKSAVSRISYLRDLALLDDYINQLLRSEFPDDSDPSLPGAEEGYDFEAYCESLNGSFECKDAGFCITDEWVCNGFSECRDNSDETDEVCKEYNRTAEENNDKEDDDDICVDGFLKCPGELTCALACDTLIDCRVVEGYDETVEIGCVHACTRDVYINGTTILTSPYFPENYKNELDCDYTIKAPKGHFIQITFNSFDVEDDITCSYDYLMVADKGSNSALKINGKRKACGIIEPNDLPVLNSTNEEINILFVTDGGVQIEKRGHF
ncbi:membrane frizzled-related protein-like [Convolutriloba macropyga]|uniref:membrane frizzled-related protein-like n=1 Tax=Convolutriloba macropyga TaxID=536237 RepID=UPI003F526B32